MPAEPVEGGMPDRRGLEMRVYFEFWEHKLIQIVWVLAGIAALFGLLLRFTSLSWATLGAFVLLGLFGELLQLDQWMLDLSPFTHIPILPGGEISAEPLVWLVSLAAVLTMAGLVGFRRRDLG